MGNFLTSGKLAIRLGLHEYQVRQLADQGKIPFERAGRYRFFAVKDLPAIRDAAVREGWLEPEPAPLAACQG